MGNLAVQGNYIDEIIRQRETWETKAVLRDLYARYFDLIRSHTATGEPALEIGGGSGRLKENLGKALVTSDVFKTPWIDVQLDAHHFPTGEGALRNVIAIDVLHHLPDPVRFFRECVRTLSKGGRILLLEPHMSIWGFLVYRFLHHEPCNLSDPVWGLRPAAKEHNFANEALPWLMLERYRKRFELEFPELRFLHSEYLDFIAYPATGGFNYGTLVPPAVIRAILACERIIPGIVMKYLTGLRSLTVLERQ
jgi:SAM-dependent methyltransferase